MLPGSTRTKFVFGCLTLVLAFLAVACGTSSNTVTGPSLDRCAINIVNSAASVGADGGTGRLTVTTGRECPWSMSSSVPWITFTTATGGQGDGSVDFLVSANSSPDVRRGRVGVGAQTVEITQQGLNCRFEFQPASYNAAAEGATSSFDVAVPSGCSWSPSTSDSWITVTNSGSRNGDGAVTFTVAPNTGGARDGRISIGGQTFTISQSAPACRYQLSAISQTFAGPGGTGSVNVAAANSCSWTATSSVPWITVVSGAADNGNGTVTFLVQANPGAARNGTLTIGGQRFTVAQVQAECSYAISPTAQSFGTGGGGGKVAITTQSVCTWNTSDVPPWVTGMPSSGTGSQTITFAVEPNAGAERTVNIILGGVPFAVTQAAGCAYTLAPGSYGAPAGGGASSFNVNTAGDCGWTSSGVPSWIAGIPASGIGPSTINFSVNANPGPARSTTFTVAGKSFTVNQAGGCTYALAPTGHSAPAGGGPSSLNLTTTAGCGWTSSGVPSWVTGVPASGTGSASINFSVAANSGAARSANIIIGGQTFAITQAAVACSYSLAPTSHAAPVGGGSSSFDVTTPASCGWTSSGVPSWITGVPASGTGSTTVNFTVAANADPVPRTATITIGGQTFAVNQPAAAVPCSYSLTPGSYTATVGGGSSSFDVTTTASCAWSSSGVPAWISGVPSSGTGTTTINFTVAANPDPTPRSASISIGGQTFTVNQAAATPCTYSLAPGSHSAPAAGGASAFDVTTASGCGWTTSGVPGWITGVPGGGTGTTTINFTVAANPDPVSRTANISVGGQTFTVNQAAAACSYSLAPTSHTAPVGGGSSAFDVTTTAGCAWSSSGVPGWITGVPSSGTGTTTINFTVAANSDPAPRSAVITIEGQTFTVNQPAAVACSYAITPGSHSAPAAGGGSTFDITTTSGCSWTSSGVPSWITGVAGSGAGTTTVAFTVEANTGPARSATITINGQTFTVNQASGCTYSISPGSLDFTVSGGSRSVTLTTGAGCSWTGSSDRPWITVPDSGTGGGTIAISVEANPSPADRTGTVTISGQTVGITQTF